MKITIRQKQAPFSHKAGIAVPVLGTSSIAKIYPTRIVIDEKVIALRLTGPVTPFTVQLDLERDLIFVFGKANEGHFRLKITGSDQGFALDVLKGPLTSVFIEKKQPFFLPKVTEKLFLGVDKKQDMDLIQRRENLEEIVPLLYRLTQKVYSPSYDKKEGTATLLPFKEGGFEKDFLPFYKAAFFDLMAPRLFDDQYQGIAPEPTAEQNPFGLFPLVRDEIRSLFFTSDGQTISFLPNLPPSLHTGKMLGIEDDVGSFDLNWSKKQIKTVTFTAKKSGPITVKLSGRIKTFRINKKKKQSASTPFFVEEGKSYFFDRFEK